MNRPYRLRRKLVSGVYQRCAAECPPGCTKRCPADCSEHNAPCRMRHKWAYSIELPPDASGHRRQLAQGGFATAEEAKAARAEIERQHRNGELVAGRNTLQQWLERWLTLPEVTELRDSTRIGYADHVRCYLVPQLGAVRLSDLTSTHVSEMLARVRAERDRARTAALEQNERRAAAAAVVNAARAAQGKRLMAVPRVGVPRPFSAASAQRLRATLRTALTSAVAHKEVPRNVAAGKAIKIRGGERPKVRLWQPDQLRTFLDAVEGERLHALYYLAAFSGLRRGELCGLSWDDVDLDRERLTVRFQNSSVGYRIVRAKPKTRESEDADVDLDAGTVAVLRAWRKRQVAERLAWGPAWSNPDNLVFTREDGSGWHPDYVTKAFQRLTRTAGLPAMRLHDLRHISASLQLLAGVDIAIVSKRLRHSTIKLTSDTYSHLIGKAGKNAAEAGHSMVFGADRTG